jgi:hypothetical protein
VSSNAWDALGATWFGFKTHWINRQGLPFDALSPLPDFSCADLGAEVVKLELPDDSDSLRTLAPVKDGNALFWKVTNLGKRGITLDGASPVCA